MNSILTQVDGKIECSCGAKAEPKDINRFLKRHPSLCSAREKYTKKVASTVKSVATSQEENVDLYRLEMIEAEGRSLTDWEKVFIKSIRTTVDKFSTKVLTDNMKTALEKVYVERVP